MTQDHSQHAVFGTGPRQILTGPDVEITVLPSVTMICATAWPDTIEIVRDRFAQAGFELADQIGRVVQSPPGTSFAVAPGRWLIDVEDQSAVPELAPDQATVADLRHARSGFVISGAQAIEVAQKLAPVDFDLPDYGVDRLVQTGSDHTVDLLIWRQAEDRFTVYVERSYGKDFWQTLKAEASEFGAELKAG